MSQPFAKIQSVRETRLSLRSLLRSGSTDEAGATAIEYGLLAALMALGISAGIGTFDDALDGVYNFIVGELETSTAQDGAQPADPNG